LSSQEIERKAVELAQHGLGYSRLQGAPTSIVSKQMTLSEFHARLDPFANDPRSAETTVWLVVLKGNVDGPGRTNPGGGTLPDGSRGMFVLLDTTGQAMAWGGLPRDRALDLNAPPPPIQARPTPAPPVVPTRGGQAPDLPGIHAPGSTPTPVSGSR
jgi:hypothetical protein